MKHSKSALPYLVLLFNLLICLPYANYQAKKSQVVKVEIKTKQETFSPQAKIKSNAINNCSQTTLVTTSKQVYPCDI